jgi:hypothetical protein
MTNKHLIITSPDETFTLSWIAKSQYLWNEI